MRCSLFSLFVHLPVFHPCKCSPSLCQCSPPLSIFSPCQCLPPLSLFFLVSVLPSCQCFSPSPLFSPLPLFFPFVFLPLCQCSLPLLSVFSLFVNVLSLPLLVFSLCIIPLFSAPLYPPPHVRVLPLFQCSPHVTALLLVLSTVESTDINKKKNETCPQLILTTIHTLLIE